MSRVRVQGGRPASLSFLVYRAVCVVKLANAVPRCEGRGGSRPGPEAGGPGRARVALSQVLCSGSLPARLMAAWSWSSLFI